MLMVLAMAASSCASSSDPGRPAVQAGAPSTDSPISQTTVSVAEAWPIGPVYRSASLTVGGRHVPTRPESVRIERFSSNTMNVEAGGCPVGSGSFILDGSTLTKPVLSANAIACDSDEAEVHRAVSELINDDPQVSVEGQTLSLETEDTTLVLRTADPTANNSPIPDGVTYRSADTSLPDLMPGNVTVTAHNYFAATVGVGGHEIVPGGGHVGARWWPAVLPTGGQGFCPR